MRGAQYTKGLVPGFVALHGRGGYLIGPRVGRRLARSLPRLHAHPKKRLTPIMRIVLLGAPGSGKGTQGERMAAHYGIPKLSTGDALRAAVSAGTALGKKAKATMDAGQLVANELVYGIVEERLNQPDAQKGFILDGFPRNIAQADVLEGMLATLKVPSISKALHLHVEDEEIITRLHSRALKEGRADDTEDVIRKRIAIYNADTSPLLDYYQRQGKLITLEGKGGLDEIFERITAAL